MRTLPEWIFFLRQRDSDAAFLFCHIASYCFCWKLAVQYIINLASSNVVTAMRTLKDVDRSLSKKRAEQMLTAACQQFLVALLRRTSGSPDVDDK